MRRRSLIVTLLMVSGVLATAGGGLFFKDTATTEFYTRHSGPGDWQCREAAAKLVTRVQDLKNDVRSRSQWGDTFTADEVNCFFRENMGKESGLCTLLPAGFHSPRVAVDGDHLKIGFRYGEGFWSSVVWVELRAWLVADEKHSNTIAVEICNLKAGMVPIASQSILDAVSEAARDSNIEVVWYRHRDHPVGLFRLYADQPRPTSQMLTLDIQNGKIAVGGQSLVDAPAGTPAGVTPLPTEVE